MTQRKRKEKKLKKMKNREKEETHINKLLKNRGKEGNQ